MAADRQEVAQFTTHFNEYQEMQAALAELEKAYRDAVQRRARLEASARARMPQLRVVEAAATPVAPWRPLYWRDAAISVGGSLVLALLAMWLVELFNRSDPAPAVIVAQALAPGLQAAPSLQTLPEYASSQGALSSTTAALLPQPTVLPRELDQDEVAGLLAAGDATGRLMTLLLLSGLSTEEAIALLRRDVDLAQGLIHVQGNSPRDVALGEPLRELFAATSADGAPVLTVGGHQVSEGEIDAQILSAAHDARLQRAAEVDAKCVRHSYIAHLVRQGIRFADLQRIVGPLPAPVLGVYATLSPAGPPAALASIDIKLPSVRGKNRG
jgi:integrase